MEKQVSKVFGIISNSTKEKASIYVLLAKNIINPTLDKTLKKYLIQFYQIKIGHGLVKYFLAKIRVMKTPEC